RLAGAIGMNDREDLSRRRKPAAGGGAAERVEEIERHEVEILVERFQRRNNLFVESETEVWLAHPDFDVEIAVERLLVGQRLVVGDAHDVVVNLRQRLSLV